MTYTVYCNYYDENRTYYVETYDDPHEAIKTQEKLYKELDIDRVWIVIGEY